MRRKCQFALAGPGGHHHRRGVAGDSAPGTCLASQSDQGMSQLDILRSELELAKKTMSLLEEGLESIAQEQAESEEEKVESPATTSAADEGESVDLVRVESLELEVERLRVEALRVEVLEEKIAALELSASSREKELLLIIEEKERRLTRCPTARPKRSDRKPSLARTSSAVSSSFTSRVVGVSTCVR